MPLEMQLFINLCQQTLKHKKRAIPGDIGPHCVLKSRTEIPPIECSNLALNLISFEMACQSGESQSTAHQTVRTIDAD